MDGRIRRVNGGRGESEGLMVGRRIRTATLETGLRRGVEGGKERGCDLGFLSKAFIL